MKITLIISHQTFYHLIYSSSNGASRSAPVRRDTIFTDKDMKVISNKNKKVDKTGYIKTISYSVT